MSAPDGGIDWADAFLQHPLPTWIFDEESLRILAVNDAMLQAYGWTREELLSMTLYDLRPLSERAHFEAYMSDANKAWGGVFIHMRKDGTWMEVEISTRPLGQGARRLRIVVAQNVEKQLRAEAAHRLSQFDYRRFIERTPDAVFTYSPDGKIVDGNPAFVAMLGCGTLAACLGKDVTDVIHPDDHGEVHARMKTTLVREQSTVPGPIRFVASDGTVRWTECRGIRVTYAGGPAVTVIARDITQRQQAEEELRLSEERFSKIFHASPACISVTRSDDTFVDVNPAFLAATGYRREELVGRSGVEIGLWHTPAERQRLAEALRAGGKVRDVGVHLVRKSGEQIDFLLSLDTFTVGGEQCVVALGHDVTERNRLEGQLRQTQKMEAIGLLAGGVAHDFNNLLTAIRGYCEILLSQLPDSGAPHDAAVHIHHSTLRAASLTGQLLALTRKQPHQPRLLVLNDIVASMGSLLSRIIGEDITLELQLAPDAGRVRADATQIEQVLLNLAVNARDAMAQGGRLTIETANLHDGGNDRVRLTVRDSGAGMTEETRRRVFEPFFTTKEVGTGLGLSIVHSIVQQNGGSVTVESTPGHGAAFHILLPRVDEQAPEPVEQARVMERPRARGPETILLVEDDEDVREFVTFVLRRAGYHVLAVEDGAAALRAAASYEGEIHLLLSDVIMPRTNGIELSAQLVAQRPHMKVLHMSGYPGNSLERQGAIHKGQAFLQKPFSSDELAEAVRRAIDGNFFPRRP